MSVEQLQQLESALAQLPLGGDTLTIKTENGPLTLTDDTGRKAVKALRLVLIQEAARVHKELRTTR